MPKDKPVLKKPSVFDFDVEALDDVPPALVQQVYGDRQPARDRSRFGAFVITPTGLAIEDGATYEDWRAAGEYIFGFEGAVQWLIGDWLVYGGSVKWGDVPAIAASLEREAKTLHDYAYVARQVQFSLRQEKLSFAHHYAVAPLMPEQQQMALQYALDNKLSVAAFRRWMRGDAPALPGGDEVEVRKNLRKISQKTLNLTESDAKQLSQKGRAEHLGYIQMLEDRLREMRGWLK